jgi:hypothetical protein
LKFTFASSEKSKPRHGAFKSVPFEEPIAGQQGDEHFGGPILAVNGTKVPFGRYRLWERATIEVVVSANRGVLTTAAANFGADRKNPSFVAVGERSVAGAMVRQSVCPVIGKLRIRRPVALKTALARTALGIALRE